MTSQDDLKPDQPPSKKDKGFLAKSMRAMVLRIGLMVVNLAIALILARILGPEQYGIYIFAFAIMSIIALPGQAGMPVISMREISFRIVDKDWARVLGIVTTTRRLVLGYCAVAGAGIALTYWFYLKDRLSEIESQAILWSAVLMPAFILVIVTGASLRGLNRLVVGQFLETLARPVLFLSITVVLVFAFGTTLTASSAMAMHACAAVLALSVALFVQNRALGPKTSGLTPIIDTKTVLKSIAPLTLVAGMQMIIGKTDILMLRVMRSPEEVGYYQVALQWANLAIIAQQAVLMVTGPSISRAYRKGNLAAVQTTLTKAARFVLIWALPLVALLFVYGEEIVRLSFGEEYIPATAAIVVLLFGRLIQASFGAIIQLAKIVGWEKLMFRLVAVAALSNVVLNYLLIPHYGIAGAAAAGIIASFIWKFALLVLAWRRLGLVSFIFGGKPDSLPDGKSGEGA